jgi:hypothetical protein
LPFPGYEAVFRTLSVHVTPDRPFTGDATADAGALIDSIRRGRLYTAIDAIASPASFEFTAENGAGSARQGGELPAGDGPVRLRVTSNAPPSFTTTIWQGTRVLATGRQAEVIATAPPDAGVYRADVRASDREGAPLWIVGNPIYVREPGSRVAPVDPPLVDSAQIFPADPFGWSVEHDPGSTADLEVVEGEGGAEMRLQYALAADSRARPGVAIAAPPHPIRPDDVLALTLRAERPMRLSVQLRTGVDAAREERWQRSVYVDANERTVVIRFSEMTPSGPTNTVGPPLDRSPSVVLVVDTTNAKPGALGRVWVKRAAFQHRSP